MTSSKAAAYRQNAFKIPPNSTINAGDYGQKNFPFMSEANGTPNKRDPRTLNSYSPYRSCETANFVNSTIDNSVV